MLYGIAAAASALLLAALLAALLRLPALRLGVVERRRQRRVPLSGGVAVVLATCGVAGVGDWLGAAPLGDEIGALLAVAVAVAALGLIADVCRFKARLLVVGTAVAAAFVVPYGETGVVGGAAAVGWIVFVALAFRSLDHADGVAGTVGVVTAFGVAACAAAELLDGSAVLLSVLAAALTGFLMHNWPPARVALGTCGSLFTGFLLAVTAVTTRAGHDPAVGTGVLFALTAVAVVDPLLVALSRRAAGRSLLRAAPDHLAHRLRRLGLTARGTALLLGAAAFCGVLVATLAHTGWAGPETVLWVAAGALVAVLALLRVPAYGLPAGRRPVRGSTRAPVSRLTLRRRATAPGRRRAPSAPVYAPRRQPEAGNSPPGSGDRRARLLESSQVSGFLRVRNG
ncbi:MULTISPECIES: MraY family glycosyltransferase [Streptomyces]|uniref:MraY family glycosyltransferase n=2 Tax=Streptomyces TaxID=1883 RepID=A0ABV9J8U9_9ACTN